MVSTGLVTVALLVASIVLRSAKPVEEAAAEVESQPADAEFAYSEAA